jgi:hypothetical protein
MKEKSFWEEWKKFNEKYGAHKMILCRKDGFTTSFKDWKYCPYCGEELCE